MEVKQWLGKDNVLGQDIWNKKYRHNNESFDEWLDRISGGNKELKKLIKEKKFLFGGRALTNRGTINKGSMYNCYSSGYCPDDLNGILQLNTNIGLTYKAQGGQGISLTQVRPIDTPVGEEYKSDGIVPFMELFNATTSSISQGGARKGALMMSIDIKHKEAPTFITIKTNEDKITKANLSLEIDDEFMEAVQEYYINNKTITLHQKEVYNGHIVEYDIIPIELYKLMINTVYDWGEPGCIFTERFRNYNLMEKDDEYQIVTCNPCGEQPMPKNFSCNLGSLNLYEFVINPFKPNSKFDDEGFKKAIDIAVEALDTIIDENKDKHALAEQRDNSLNYRNIGLGIFGYADALMALGLKFGDEHAQSMTKHIFELLFKESVISSNKLAKKKGTFPKYTDKVWESEIIKKHFTQGEINELKPYGIRNCSLVSIAPTGSIATMMGMSGGCEPEFALSYKRRTENLKDSYQVNCKPVEDYFKLNNLPNNSELPDYFITSAQIKWTDRIDTQAIMQESVDTAISSTINLDKATPLEVIEQIYLYAWSKGLKGVTIFRDGCKREGILTTNNEGDKDDGAKSDVAKKILPRGYIIDADNCAIGKKRKLTTGCGSLHCTAFFDPINGDLLETYLSKGSSGGCNNFMIGLSRMISLASRGGVNIESIIDQLNSSGTCPSYAVRSATKHDTSKGSCCPIAIGNALKEMYNEIQEDLGLKDSNEEYQVKEHDKNNKIPNIPKCPECGEDLIFEGGCICCKNCGWSKCD